MRPKRRSIASKLVHGALGVLLAALAHWDWALGVSAFGMFAVYEIYQDKAIKDNAYLDIRDALYGFVSASVVLLVLSEAIDLI